MGKKRVIVLPTSIYTYIEATICIDKKWPSDRVFPDNIASRPFFL